MTSIIKGRILKETGKAIQIESHQIVIGKTIKAWLPKSQIECWSILTEKHSSLFKIPVWILNSKG